LKKFEKPLKGNTKNSKKCEKHQKAIKNIWLFWKVRTDPGSDHTTECAEEARQHTEKKERKKAGNVP